VLRRVDDAASTRGLADGLSSLSALRRWSHAPSRVLSPPGAREQHIQGILDGNPLRGPRGHATPAQPSCHLVTRYEAQPGVVLAAPPVPEPGNEITVEATRLTPTQVHSRSVTADVRPTRAHLRCRHYRLRWR
jgi:hypothetical protein